MVNQADARRFKAGKKPAHVESTNREQRLDPGLKGVKRFLD